MVTRIVTIALNQQQLELVDRTLAKGLAEDRAALIRHALRRYAARHLPEQGAATRPSLAVG
ncbi:hypothetical protein IED13_14550 [Bosea sp. SSUT16]|uniref:Uncharacterized protein n=1 Tax=Bosea spartocytisi TaxID=2773451 RepID=A0A927I0W1_9HYPH|nr:hypothetical protein [Bosea spartocytisi]MBD3846926.1 hypothetical protein [Bosea spartocytisi]MCT4474285.1 ribbon-helix-helix domain-containing protein [Bosea spartocytisi]